MAKPVWATNDIPTATQFNEFLTNINFARKAGSEAVTSSVTLQDDNELTVPVVANAIYRMTSVIYYSGPAAADIKVLYRTPTSGSMTAYAHGLVNTAAGAGDNVLIQIVGNSSSDFGTLGSGTQVLMVEGMLITAGTAGDFKLEWAQNTSNASAVNVLAGSFIDLRRVS